jgi:uncharacterized membrane protein YphA (DoxX/SURF4 family)
MLLRRIARPLLAAPFIRDGVKAVLWPAEQVERQRPKMELLKLDQDNATQFVRIHGAVQAGLGIAVAVGLFPRVASLGLALVAAEEAWVNNPFDGDAKGDRGGRTDKFVESVGKVGAALIAGVDYQGRPGVKWRIEKARKNHHRNVDDD